MTLGLPAVILLNKPLLTRIISTIVLVFLISALIVPINFSESQPFIDKSSLLNYAFEKSVLVFVCLILVCIIAFSKKPESTLKLWVPLVALSIPLSLPYFMAPVFIDELTTIYPPDESRYKALTENIGLLDTQLQPSHIYMFVSPTCIHCRRAMKKISIATENSRKLPQSDITVIVPVDLLPEQFDGLSVLAGYQIIELEDEDFIKITTGRFPMVVYTNADAKLEYIWNGASFNYRVLSYISSK